MCVSVCVSCPIFNIKTGFTQRNLCLMPHARWRTHTHTLFSMFIVFMTEFSFSLFFSLPANNFWQCTRWGVREFSSWCAGLVSTMASLCGCVSVCVCSSMLGLLAFGALWSDILINCTLACWNGPTCNRERGRERRREAESDTVSCFTCSCHVATCLVACTWLKFHLSHLQWLLALSLLLLLLLLLCLLFYG